jgi:Domain of unknown function (DUF5658)
MLRSLPRSATLPPSLARAFLALFLFYGLADLVTTGLDVHSGQGWEGNPVAAFLLAHMGFSGLVVLKFLALGGIYAFALFVRTDRLSRILTTVVFYVFAAVFAFVSLSNLYGLLTGTDLFHLLLYRLVFFLISL